MATDQSYRFGKNPLIELSLRLFYFVGMWPQSDSTIVYTVLGYTLQAFTSLAWTVAKSVATGMLETRSELILFLPTTVYAYSNVYRGFIIMRKHKTIDSILNEISDSPLTKNEYEKVQQKINFFNKTSWAFILSMSLGLISACANPIITQGNELPVPVWLPFNDWKSNRLDYAVALVFSYAGIASFVVVCSFTPILVWYLIFINTMKIEILGKRLRILGCEAANGSLEDLLNFIRRHREIVSNISEVEDIFSGVFLYQIITSAVCICSVAYLMAFSSSNESNNLLMYVALAGIYIYEIFLLIYYANETALSSDQLSYRLYESNWTGMPIEYQKIMIVLFEKWKKPTELVVGKVFPMRINILTSILNVAYSILNVLRKGQP